MDDLISIIVYKQVLVSGQLKDYIINLMSIYKIYF